MQVVSFPMKNRQLVTNQPFRRQHGSEGTSKNEEIKSLSASSSAQLAQLTNYTDRKIQHVLGPLIPHGETSCSIRKIHEFLFVADPRVRPSEGTYHVGHAKYEETVREKG